MSEVAAESVEIARIAAGGDGVGKLADGMTVFVPRTAPGDLVELARVSRRGRFARAELGRIVRASPARVEPRCRHYDADRCGGCQLQHVGTDPARAAKQAIVGDALRRLGKLDLPDPPLDPAVAEWGYRAKITLASDPTGKRLGFHPIDRPDRVFDLVRCEIADPALMDLWTALRELVGLLPPLEHLVLRRARDGSRHLIVAGRSATVWSRASELARAVAERGQPATIWWQPKDGRPRVLAGAKGAGSGSEFEQVNPAMGDRARAHAIESLGELPGQLVWDLYAGIGETSDLLAAKGARVESVERDPAAVRTAAERGLPDAAIRRVTGRAEAVIGTLGRPDLVVTNPPRTGMDERVVAAIAAAAPRRVVYLSCDPATLARDLARYRAASSDVRVTQVRAFDLFPQTAHVETVAVLERA